MKALFFALTLVAVSKAFACDPVAAATETARQDALEHQAKSVAIAEHYETDKIFGEPAAIVHYTFTHPDGSVAIGKAIVDLTSCRVENSGFEFAKSIPTK
jgi:hypothetical protein